MEQRKVTIFFRGSGEKEKKKDFTSKIQGRNGNELISIPVQWLQ